MNEVKYDEGLKYALIALSFFRARNIKVPRFKSPSKAHTGLSDRVGSASGGMVSRRAEWVRMARKYILLARKHGWRGSMINTVMELNITKKGGYDNGLLLTTAKV